LNQWEVIQKKGYLTWVTRPSPLTHYNSLDGVIGLEYEILNQFCNENQINLVVIHTHSNSQLFSKLDDFSTDIAGANLTLIDKRLDKYMATTHYDETFIRIISSYRKPKIKSLKHLKNYQGSVLKNSSYEKSAQILVDQYDANINTIGSIGIYDLLQRVIEDKIDYTLVDSNIVKIYSAYIPRLRLGKKLSEANKLVFYIPNKADNSLKLKLDAFIDSFKQQNKIQDYKKFLIRTLPNSKPADTVNFLKNYKNRWPLVKSMIYETANKYDISPILLGAISYQESHWNPKAISPTLVKGLMMLTKGVANEQHVTDRFDPLQSLEGGAGHFIKMKEIIPDRILEPDKTNFALAAYNIGYGNLEQARVITQKNGKNPDLWNDVKLYLPLLNDLKNKKVDGKTAVRYVENIHVYQNILQWKEQL
jgi:membrane-bound lytic murein transglycosylase F